MDTYRPVAIVTGASRGLGRATAGALHSAGYHVIIDARGEQQLRDAARQIGAPDTVTALPGDLTSPAHRAELVAEAHRLGGLDLLINNAGTLGASPLPALADYPAGELRAALEINVIAPLALTSLALPTLRERGGALINITSDAATQPYAGWGGYGAGKAALEQASNILAAEEPNVRVWWVDPGDIRTDMHQLAFPGEDISDRPLPAEVVPGLIRLIFERPPSGRYLAADWVSGRPAGADAVGGSR